MNRRHFIVTSAMGLAAGAAGAEQAQQANLPEAIRKLKPMLDGVKPITDDERQARMEKARRLMAQNKLSAILCEGGTSLYYYTGSRGNGAFWVLPAKGEPLWFLPEGKEQGARLGAVRTFTESEGPYKKIAQALGGAARIGIEERTRFAVYDGLHKEAPAMEIASADPVTIGCRVIKSAAELALMQRANDITIEAYKAALASLREGMTNRDLSALISAAYRAMGVQGAAMANFGQYSAFPHGSIQPQPLKDRDIVLIDDGCTVDGYQSDITRTTVFGEPTKRQTQIWNLERKAQDAALAAAKPGATCESVDAAARKVITDFGFGPGYKVPGLPHRTGHGIGLDGHEWTNLVKGNKTKLEPGMCFSDEPMIAIYGEFGIRLEDCMYITEGGARMFTKQSPAIDQPFG